MLARATRSCDARDAARWGTTRSAPRRTDDSPAAPERSARSTCSRPHRRTHALDAPVSRVRVPACVWPSASSCSAAPASRPDARLRLRRGGGHGRRRRRSLLHCLRHGLRRLLCRRNRRDRDLRSRDLRSLPATPRALTARTDRGALTCGALNCGAPTCGALTCGALTCGALTCGALTCGALTCGALTCGALTCGRHSPAAQLTCGALTCGVGAGVEAGTDGAVLVATAGAGVDNTSARAASANASARADTLSAAPRRSSVVAGRKVVVGSICRIDLLVVLSGRPAFQTRSLQPGRKSLDSGRFGPRTTTSRQERLAVGRQLGSPPQVASRRRF